MNYNHCRNSSRDHLRHAWKAAIVRSDASARPLDALDAQVRK